MIFIKKILFLLAFYLLVGFEAFAQIPKDKTDDFIINILKGSPDWFQQIVYNPMEYQVQIVYTQINRDSSNRAHFETHTFQADEFYFYPASWMKLPLAVFSLEKLNELKLNKNDLLKIEPLFGNHNHEYDEFKKIQPPSFTQMIKQAFIVSDNSVYNPLYDFVTQQRANQRFSELNLKKAVVCNRFSISEPAEHRHSNFLEIISNTKEPKVLYQQIQTFNPVQPHCTYTDYNFGEKHYEKGVLVNGPKNFYYNNYIPITEMNLFMQKLFFPKETHSTFNLTKDDYTFLKKYLAILPRQCTQPRYNESEYPDCYMKYFIIGGSKERLDNSVRIFDKLGQYFGWTCDAAYIVDYANGVEFFLSAVIYTNSKHEVADNPTEYANIAAPFFAQLGKSFYEYELKRKKKFTPHINFVSLSMEDGLETKEVATADKKPVTNKKTEKSVVTKLPEKKSIVKPISKNTILHQTIPQKTTVVKKDSSIMKQVPRLASNHKQIHHSHKKKIVQKTKKKSVKKSN